MFRRYFMFLWAVFASTFLMAQKSEKPVDTRDYMYKHESSGGVRIQTNGVSPYFQFGWIKDIKRTRMIEVEYTYFINYQQKRQKSVTQNGRDFQYGVQNRFHAIRVSVGFKRVIADKAPRNGVCLSIVGFAGVSLGLVKPYYLKLIQPGPDSLAIVIKPERYSAANADRFLDPNYIVEAAPIRYGLNQIQPVPGVHGKLALDFDWGSRDKVVKALEAGVMLDLYYKNIPVMVNKTNRFFQIGAFIGFHFGKRW